MREGFYSLSTSPSLSFSQVAEKLPGGKWYRYTAELALVFTSKIQPTVWSIFTELELFLQEAIVINLDLKFSNLDQLLNFSNLIW